jgi:Phage replication protein CRI
MIDFYDAEFFFPLDLQVYRDLPGHERPKPPTRRLKRQVRAAGWMSTAEVIFKPDFFRIRVCPQKLLGSWNSWGTDDLREYVSLTAPLVLQELGHRLTAEQEASIAAGEYRISEVHIARAFHLVNYSQQEFIRRLFYAIAESHKAQWAKRGEGIVINGDNRRVSAYLYAKIDEFITRGWPRYKAKLSAARATERLGIALSRNSHLLAALLGPRLEFRFGDQFFRQNPLARGSAWRPGTAAKLYHRELQRLKLPASVNLMWQRDQAQEVLKPGPYASLRLWHHGERLQSLGSPSTVKRHVAAIREALGIDIRQPSATLIGRQQALEVRAVLEAENSVDMPGAGDDPEAENLMHEAVRHLNAGVGKVGL